MVVGNVACLLARFFEIAVPLRCVGFKKEKFKV